MPDTPVDKKINIIFFNPKSARIINKISYI